MRFFLLVLVLVTLTTQAGVEVVQFENPENSQRYQNLIAELRCLVCQNQNLADSNADLAKDLRNQVYDMIKAGSSDSDITNYMVDRYGDFVLYRPPFKATTLFLWLVPPLVLFGAVLILVTFIRRQRNRTAIDIGAEDQQRIHDLLQDKDKN